MQAAFESIRQRETVPFTQCTLDMGGESGVGKSSTTRSLANEPFLGDELHSTVRFRSLNSHTCRWHTPLIV